MKKNLLYALALATTMVACTDDYTDWGIPQQNDPEAAKSASLTVTATESIDFATLTDADEYVTIFTAPTATADAGAKVEKYTVTIDGKYTLPVTLNENKGQVVTAELENALISIHGRRPTERTLSGLVKAYVKNTDGMTVIPSTTVEIKATPEAPIIEDAYYLVGAPNGWAWDNGDYKFNHSDKDVYDDPVFTLTFTAPVDNDGNRVDCWFKINPKSGFEEGKETSGTLGCEVDGSEELEGKLVPKGDTSCGAMKLPASDGAKFYKLTLNMMDYTYTVDILNFEEFIYVPGDPKWNPASAPALRSPNYDGVYTGYAYLTTNGFKFVETRNGWEPQWNYTYFTSYSDGITGSDNICAPSNAFYYLKANLPNTKLEIIPMEWGIIGDATAGGWDADTKMEWNADEEAWVITTNLEGGKQFKFRYHNDKGDWTYNYGGDIDDLSEGGSNIAVAETGTYEIKLFLTRSTSNKIYATCTKK